MKRRFLFIAIFTLALSCYSCRDTKPGDNDSDPDLGMTTDSVFTDEGSNEGDTSGADTGLDGE
ncbi:hypothetical protein [Flavobacterium coralii]|uniref:hypothetical protein n=1 Tax=Flavobacterium coralii TaxID=2838017 RepID=UPI0026C7B550|tara:strand:+ start:170 stop:358 length:189 start_codon:yes stop_codon:yes gene_type:complete